MSGEDGQRLRYLELPEEPGRRLGVWLPAPEGEAFGPEAFTAGQGFTVDLNGERWHAVILSAEVRDGGVELVMRIGERLP